MPALLLPLLLLLLGLLLLLLADVVLHLAALLQQIQAHTHDLLLEFLGLLLFRFNRLVHFTLTVHPAPLLGPGQLLLLDLLVEHLLALLGEEEGGLTVPLNELLPAPWVDLVLSVHARFRFHNHFLFLEGRVVEFG